MKKILATLLAAGMIMTDIPMLPVAMQATAVAATEEEAFLPQTKAPTITGLYWNGDRALNAIVQIPEETNALNAEIWKYERSSQYITQRYGWEDNEGVWSFLQLAYSLDGGKNWINTEDRTEESGYWERDSWRYVEDLDERIEFPTTDLHMHHIYEDVNLLNLEVYDDDRARAKATINYLSQGKATYNTADSEDNWQRFDLNLNDKQIMVKARCVLTSQYYDEETEASEDVVSYSPWSSVFTYDNSVTPETLNFTRGGELEGPELSLLPYGNFYISPSDELREMIAQNALVCQLDGYGEFYSAWEDTSYWDWYIEVSLNDDPWIIYDYSGVNSTLMGYDRADVSDFFTYRGHVLQPGDTVKLRVSFVPIYRVNFVEDDFGDYQANRLELEPEASVYSLPSNAIDYPVDGKYYIWYDLNSGSWPEGSDHMDYFTENTSGKLNLTTANYTPSKYGYQFDGWYTTADFKKGTKVTSINLDIKTHTHLYAKWTTPGEYTITYETGYSGVYNPNPDMYTPLMDDITLQPAEYSGYEFLGWYANADRTGTPVTKISVAQAKNITLYAKWNAPEYTITYVLNGGTNAASNPKKFQVNENGYAATLKAPTKKGYIFDGWYTDKDFRSSLYSENNNWYLNASGNVTVYAKWIRGRWDIHYVNVVNKVVDAKFTPFNPNPESYTYGDEVTLTNLSATGYTFGGWFTDEACTVAATPITTTTEGSKTFYAKWTEKNYTITYELNAATGQSPAPETITNTNSTKRRYSKEYTLLAPTTTDTDFVFVGWYADVNFNSVPVTKLSGAKNYILYAKWRRTTAHIDYVMNGGKNSTSNPAFFTIKEDGTNDTILVGGSKNGYIFDGWYYDGSFKNPLAKKNGGYAFTAEDNIRVYAKWKLKFTDVKLGGWQETAIRYMLDNGYMSGKSDTLFDPDTTMNRGQMVAILWNMEGKPKVTGTSPFADVTTKNTFYSPILWAASNKVVNGYADGTFGPKDELTRQQIAAILMNYARYKGIAITGQSTLTQFQDVDKISKSMLNAVKWAVGNKVISGRSGGTIIDPKGNASRVEVAAMIMKFCKSFNI